MRIERRRRRRRLSRPNLRTIATAAADFSLLRAYTTVWCIDLFFFFRFLPGPFSGVSEKRMGKETKNSDGRRPFVSPEDKLARVRVYYGEYITAAPTYPADGFIYNKQSPENFHRRWSATPATDDRRPFRTSAVDYPRTCRL